MSREEPAIRVLIKRHSALDEHLHLAALNSEPDIDIVNCVSEPLDVLMAVRQQDINVVVVSEGQQDKSGLVSHLLAQFPDITVLSLESDGRFWIEQRCHSRWRLHDLPPSQIARALRHAVRNPCDFNHALQG